jgi:hypothetical protein
MAKLAYTYAEAAEACGYSERVIRRAVDTSDLVPRYANSKPVIEATELERWLRSLPSTPPSRVS